MFWGIQMVRNSLPFLLLLGISWSIPSQAKNCIPVKDLVSKVAPRSVQIIIPYSEIPNITPLVKPKDQDNAFMVAGSGVVLNPQGQVATAAHLFFDEVSEEFFNPKAIAVKLGDRVFSYKLKSLDKKFEGVAILSPLSSRYPEVKTPISFSSVQMGDMTYSIGYPLGAGPLFYSGYATGDYFVSHFQRSFLATQTQTNFGASGSGLFDCEANLVGILFGANPVMKEISYWNKVEELIPHMN